MIDPKKEKSGYKTGVYDPGALNGSIWKLDLCHKKRCPQPPNCSSQCPFGFSTDKFGCQATCQCGQTLQVGDMTFTNERSVRRVKPGQSDFVPKYFKAWDNIKRGGKYIIPYSIQPKWAEQKADNSTLKNITAKDLLMRAFTRLESNSSLKFAERNKEETYLYFKGFGESTGCHSYVGHVSV